ncbi:MAG: hypothetical protein PVJ04_07650 [Gemmatimonadota bacterium]
MSTKDSRPRAGAPWTVTMFLIVGIAITAVAWVTGRSDSGGPDVPGAMVPSARTEAAAKPAAAVPAASIPEPEFTVPKPGDPEYADYLEMLKQPQFRSSVENTEGYRPPYDPEWRSMLTGRRKVGPTDLELTDGAGSISELAKELLRALENGDSGLLNALRVSREEYQLLIWPEFPQSRPYLHIPPDEAWSFQYTKLREGMSGIYSRYGETPWNLVAATEGPVETFTNFTIHRGVEILAENNKSGERVIFDKKLTVVERNGRFKILSFGK